MNPSGPAHAGAMGRTKDMKKYNWKAAIAVGLGLVATREGFQVAGWNYNLFRDQFIFWRAAVQLGTPVAVVLILFWIFQKVEKFRSK